MKIPQDRRFYVSNGSDLTPSIHYTKSIDFDEEGYLKLSPPMPRLIASSDNEFFVDLLDMIMIGSASSQTYKALTTGSGAFDINLPALTVTADGGVPGGNGFDSDYHRFVGWKGGDWYINGDQDILSLQATAGTVWDIENTDAIRHPELFVNRNTIVGAVGSTIQQYTEADMDGTSPTGNNSGTTLTLPSVFTITAIRYSNYRVGIGTRNDIGESAYFFVWDGATTSAGTGYPVNAPAILDVVPYRNSWAILTSIGQLLYFNGGGFDVLGNLPPYFFSGNWIIKATGAYRGRSMWTDGDVIYFNIGSLLESTLDGSGIIPGFYSGVWCYDPLVGIYHKWGVAHSKIVQSALTPSSGTFTSVAHLLLSGDKVLYSTGKTYYAIYLTDDTFKLADSYDEAIEGTASADFASSSATLTWIKRTDWSQVLATPTRGCGLAIFQNGSGITDDGVYPIFANLDATNTSLANDDITGVMAPAFDNLGCIAYQKVKAEGVTDTWQKLVVKYRPLQGGDKIVVKYKYKDFYSAPIAIGEAGDISADSGTDAYITWSDGDTFTTTKDLTGVEAGHEVEFYSGAGAGSTAHISSLSENAGTWTVNLDETIRGASSGKKSTCVIDAFYKAETITKDNQKDENLSTIPVGVTSKFIQVKLELRGRNITVEEFEIIRAPHQ